MDMDSNYILSRIAKAEEDLETLNGIKLNNKHLMVELLKNRIQEWREMIEGMEQ